jgi:hypothetical protein
MNIICKPNYSASITIGSQIEYSNDIYSKETLISILQQFQKEQIKKRNVYLSACISECDIVMSGQLEPHFKLDFINYPKFPLEEKPFKKEIELLTVFLMDKLSQNRIVIVYHNETKMFEKNEEIDPRI